MITFSSRYKGNAHVQVIIKKFIKIIKCVIYAYNANFWSSFFFLFTCVTTSKGG